MRCILEAESILRFLTARGTINFGLVVPPSNFIFDTIVQDQSVIVIGAGISGLAAARSLSNMGFKVTMLESRRRIGGRISDDSHHFGVCVGKGNQEINGALNNPLTFLALQAGAEIDPLEEDELQFVEAISKDDVNRALLHFYLLLDSPPEEWKMESPVPDFPLYEKLCQFHKLFLTESSSQFTEEQLKVFYLAMGLLEAQLGSDLEAISSLYWDESDKFPQYGGPACCRVTSGFHSILTKMAQGLTIKLNSQVTKIDFSEENVQVHTQNSNVYSSSKVVVTIPVSLMPEIIFEPELPTYKINAFKSIGIGNCEKAILKFGKRFWMENTPTFACLPEFESRNHINHFKDLTYKKKEGPFVLEVVLGGRAVAWLQERTDIEVVEACLAKLRQLFPKDSVESPLGWCVTRWYQQPGSKMTRSFVKPETTSQIYDDLSFPVDNKLYFAGEATFRPIPGSTVGSFLSGIRAARAIYESYLPVDDDEALYSPVQHIKEEIPDCI